MPEIFCIRLCSRAIPVIERLNQHSMHVPVRHLRYRFYRRQGCKQRLGVLERRAHLVSVCDHYLLASLRIVPDDQRLTTLDVFLVVSHRQSVSDLLIFSFFGIEGGGDIYGNVLGRIMQHTTVNDRDAHSFLQWNLFFFNTAYGFLHPVDILVQTVSKLLCMSGVRQLAQMPHRRNFFCVKSYHVLWLVLSGSPGGCLPAVNWELYAVRQDHNLIQRFWSSEIRV